MAAKISKFDSNESLDQTFCEHITQLLAAAIEQRGHAYLVVSGGRTPKSLFQLLSQQPLAWQQVTVLLADDRVVAATDDASNAKLVREKLLQNKAHAAEFIELIDNSQEPTQAVATLNTKLASLPAFDVVILGLGEDGHTASLFPCSKEITEGLTTTKPALLVQPTTAPHLRVSLSLQRLLKSRQIFFHLSGANKNQALQQALQNNDENKMPASAVLNQQHVPVEVMFAEI